MTFATMPDLSAHDRFILRQRFRFVVNEYEFSLPLKEVRRPANPSASSGRSHSSSRKTSAFMSINLVPSSSCGSRLGSASTPERGMTLSRQMARRSEKCRRSFRASLLRSTYALYDAAGEELARVTESNLGVALIRRLVGFVPYLDSVANWLPIPYNFVFLRNGAAIGHHRRQMWKLIDVYTIDLSADTEKALDRRLVLALAVAMDALQAR